MDEDEKMLIPNLIEVSIGSVTIRSCRAADTLDTLMDRAIYAFMAGETNDLHDKILKQFVKNYELGLKELDKK